jgi:hypothetical protein
LRFHCSISAFVQSREKENRSGNWNGLNLDFMFQNRFPSLELPRSGSMGFLSPDYRQDTPNGMFNLKEYQRIIKWFQRLA